MGSNDNRSLVTYIEDHYSVPEDPTCTVTGEALTAGDRVYLYLRGDDVKPRSLGRNDLSAVERSMDDDIATLANKDQLVVKGTLTEPTDAHGPSGKKHHGIADVSVVDVNAGS